MVGRDLPSIHSILLNVVAVLLVGVTVGFLLKLYQARCRFRQLSKDGAVGLFDTCTL